MRLIAAVVAAAGAALAGCSEYGTYDNPYDTTEEREVYELAKAYALEVELEAIRTDPPLAAPTDRTFDTLDIDSWKAATVDIASPATLERMRMSTMARIEHLKSRIAAAKAGSPRLYEAELRVAKHDLAIEERRLSVITSAR